MWVTFAFLDPDPDPKPSQGAHVVNIHEVRVLQLLREGEVGGGNQKP